MTDPHERLQNFRNELKLSQAKFAVEMSCKDYLIKDIESGRQKLPLWLAAKIEEKYGLRKAWLLLGDGEPYEKTIPKPDTITIELIKDLTASAGGGCAVLDEATTETIELPSHKNINYIKVKGESMYPFFFDGDIVAFATNKTDIIDGDIYLVSLEGELFIKKIIKVGPYNLSLISLNEAIAPILAIDLRVDNFKICGRYEWSVRKKA